MHDKVVVVHYTTVPTTLAIYKGPRVGPDRSSFYIQEPDYKENVVCMDVWGLTSNFEQYFTNAKMN